VSGPDIISPWRCDAEEPRHGYGPAGRCWRSGDRFRDGRWLCTPPEMVHLGDAPPQYMASDLLSANAITGIVCSAPASIAAFVEHCYQEAQAIIEQTKPVVLALARALIEHPERTLNSAEIDLVIMQALTSEAAPVEHTRRADWARVQINAAEFAARGSEN
jgi:hypothetical protein